MKTSKKGISLIVLVITIIVMIILAAAIIITLANNGIIGKANQAKEDMTEAQIREAANLIWADLYLAGEEITGELIKQHLEASGISKAELDKYTIAADENGVVVKDKTTGELSEHGFYYNVLYAGEFIEDEGTDYETTIKYGIVFYEGGEAALYVDIYPMAEQAQDALSVTIANPTYVCGFAGSWEEKDGKITFASPFNSSYIMEATFDPTGLTAEIPDGSDVLTLNYTEQEFNAPSLNKKYAGTFTDTYTDSNGDAVTEQISVEAVINNDAIRASTIETINGVSSPAVDVEFEIKSIHADNHLFITEAPDSEDDLSVMISADGRNIFFGEMFILELVEETTVTPNYASHSGTIPEGGVYYVGVTNMTVGDYSTATATYNPGDSFPATISEGDVYVYGEYEYRQMASDAKSIYESLIGVTFDNGWFVTALDKTKPSYTMALGSVNNRLATNFFATYNGNTALTTAPEIPNSTVNMSVAFEGCTSLTTVQEIPVNVTCMFQTYANCTALKTVPVIPSKVTTLYETFHNCTGLETVPDLSNARSLINMGRAFWASGIKEVPDISYLTKVTNFSAAFSECANLTKVGKLPPNVVDMGSAFDDCTALQNAPDFSNLTKVENMQYTFSGCTALTSAPTIPSTVKDMERAFYGCEALVAPPDMTNAVNVETLEYTFYNCKKLKAAPNLSNLTKLTNMMRTFENCTALEMTPVIPSAVEDMTDTFKNCTALTTATTIPASVTELNNTFWGCINLTGTIEVNANPTYVYSPFSQTVKPITITGLANADTRKALNNYGYQTNVTVN